MDPMAMMTTMTTTTSRTASTAKIAQRMPSPLQRPGSSNSSKNKASKVAAKATPVACSACVPAEDGVNEKVARKGTRSRVGTGYSSISLSSLIKSFLYYYIALNCIMLQTTTTTTSAAAAATTTITGATSATSLAKGKRGSHSNGGLQSGAGGFEGVVNAPANSGYNSVSVGDASSSSDGSFSWDHRIDLNEDFRILWTIINQDITFEIRARTLGYVGLGFSLDGTIHGADMAIGWVDRGQTYFQDRYIKRLNDGSSDDVFNGEPIVDPSQDYVLILGYENATHTVLRYRRKLDTCDTRHDIAITNDTMRLIYMYHAQDPPHGTLRPGTLPNPASAFRTYRALVLTQRPQSQLPYGAPMRMLELRNEDVELPSGEATLYWCKMFKLEDIQRKHHLVKYEPIYDASASVHYLQHITLYECEGGNAELEEMARELGRQCAGVRDIPAACNAIVVSWSRGSEGFAYPTEAGYPIETRQAKYYLMETHYNNVLHNNQQQQQHGAGGALQMADNSGLKIYFTQKLRQHDAGMLSIGMDPNWRHIIPPGQKRVVSEGQCIEDCTGYALPSKGINIFAALMRTHQIGKEVTLRQLRKNEELPPIAHDGNIDVAYQDFRRLPAAVRIMPGDRLVAECIYDSSSRKAITLGGLTMKEESCTVLTLYYPRQKKLTTCHSLPSLPTVLHSLGIEQLATNSNPVLISAPSQLAGMTLETRLLSYDWHNQFNEFQDATRSGSFKPLCWGVKNHVVPGSEFLEGYSINITKTYRRPRRCKPKPLLNTEQTLLDVQTPPKHELDGNNIIEGAARSSRSSSAAETHPMLGAHGSTQLWVLLYAAGFIILQQVSCLGTT